jgi:hypothetical protein
MPLLLLAQAGTLKAGQDSFTIVREDATPTSRVVSVRIDRRLSSSELARIAETIKTKSSSPTTRHVVVSYFLPGMPLELRPWASVDTTPKTRVLVSGLTLEEAEIISADAIADKRDTIGSWLTEIPSSPGRITIFNQKGRTYLEWVQRSGQKLVDEVMLTRGTRGSRVDLKAGGDDYYMIKVSGELELRNKDRLVAVAERVTAQRGAPMASSKAQGGSELSSAVEQGSLLPAADTAASVSAEAALPEVAKPLPVRRQQVRRAKPSRNASTTVYVEEHMKPLIR